MVSQECLAYSEGGQVLDHCGLVQIRDAELSRQAICKHACFAEKSTLFLGIKMKLISVWASVSTWLSLLEYLLLLIRITSLLKSSYLGSQRNLFVICTNLGFRDTLDSINSPPPPPKCNNLHLNIFFL